MSPEYNTPATHLPPPSFPPLKDTVQRYASVAKSTTRKEFDHFINHIRDRWAPLPPITNLSEDDSHHIYRHPGWTEEGAFAMCLCKLLFWPYSENHFRQGGRVLCPAEEEGQVLLRPTEELIEDLQGPLFEAREEGDIVMGLEKLREGLQKQVDASMPKNDHSVRVELPSDFGELMRVTDGVGAAGVPSRNNGLQLIYPLKYNRSEEHLPGEGPCTFGSGERMWWRTAGLEAFAAWKLGGDHELWRVIYYVLCRELNRKGSKNGEKDAPLVWKVIHRRDIDVEVYDNLSQFLQRETDDILAEPSKQDEQWPLEDDDRYPDGSSYTQTKF